MTIKGFNMSFQFQTFFCKREVFNLLNLNLRKCFLYSAVIVFWA